MVKRKILIVGGFPPMHQKIYGGIVSECRILINSRFSSHYTLLKIDSTQISNPAPGLFLRMILALKRLCAYSVVLFFQKPNAVILFASEGGSIVEKGVMAWLARCRSIPVFFFPRAGRLINDVTKSRFTRFWVLPFIKGATHLLCQGPAWQRFARFQLGYPRERSPLVLNWTATREYLAIGEARKNNTNTRKPCILFLGWLDLEKGVFELLECASMLSKQIDFKLIFCGKGKSEEKLKKFVVDSSIEDFVQFAGWVDGNLKRELIKKSDILVLPSWHEGFPNSVIEAMAAKMAVVVTKVGEIPEVLADGVEVLLVEPRDTAALYIAIKRLLDDSKYRCDLANRGHIFAESFFSEEKSIGNFITIIDESIDNFVRKPSDPIKIDFGDRTN